MGLMNSSVKVAEDLTDAPQNTDSDQDGAQFEPTKVHPSDHTDHAVYRIDPQTSGMKLRHEPRSDDGIDRSIGVLSRPIRQTKTDSLTRIHLGREESEED